MSSPSPRLSRRRLLALGTFLVPLTVLAVLGWNELRRSGAMTEASLEREAQQFLASARQAIEQRIELQVPAALAASERLLREETPTRATILLRDQAGVDAALDVLLLDERGDVQWPLLPLYSYSLPLAREPETPGTSQSGERARFADLAKAELLMANGHEAAAVDTSRLAAESAYARWKEAQADGIEIFLQRAKEEREHEWERLDREERERAVPATLALGWVG